MNKQTIDFGDTSSRVLHQVLVDIEKAKRAEDGVSAAKFVAYQTIGRAVEQAYNAAVGREVKQSRENRKTRPAYTEVTCHRCGSVFSRENIEEHIDNWCEGDR